MKSICPSALSLAVFLSFMAGVVTRTHAAEAEPATPTKPTVTGRLGLAQVARAGGGFEPVKVGTVFNPGDLVQTANGSALDVSFGKTTGVVRLLESTTVEFASLSQTNIGLKLKGGQVGSRWKKQPAGTRLQIEVTNGLAGILEGDVRIGMRGYLVLMEGTALFVEMRGEAEPVVHLLDSKKPVYYSPPDHAILPAPKELQSEVSKQLKASLPKK